MAASSRSQAKRVAVIGGGVIGLATAFRLKRAGADVVVYERGLEIGGGTTARAAGMLGVAYESASDDNPALFHLARRSLLAWPEFASEIQRLSGEGMEYDTTGAIACALTANEEKRLEELAAACQARDMAVRWLSPADLKRQEPAVSEKVRAGLLLPSDAQVDAQLLLQRLAAALQRIGVAFRFGRHVERVQQLAGGEFLLPDGARHDAVLLATGAALETVRVIDRFSAQLDTGIGAVVPVKGQMLALAPVDAAPRHVLRMTDCYIAPKSRWILVGASVERGASDTAVDPAIAARLRAAAAKVVPALADAPEITSWAGVRPGTADDTPMIGTTNIPALFAALGSYRNGVLLAPAIGDLAAGIIMNGEGGELARAFSPLRFHPGI